MREGFGGYFRTADEYIKIQVPESNEREMLYLPVAQIGSPNLKAYVAHEFVHLITFNQKDRLRQVREEVWLNEARADFASNILGYDNVYEGSNLQRRVRDFLEKPSDALTEWKEVKYDYAAISLFTYYLADHYGVNMLSDSLKSKSIGIPSINEVLLKNGYAQNFSQVFTDWTVALVVGNCSSLKKYCYLNKHLASFKISPTLIFLPFADNSFLTITDVTKNWSGNWQKIIGGNQGNLKVEFSSLNGLDFSVPYILFDKNNRYSVEFFKLDQDEKGEITIDDFSEKYNSLMVIPSLHTKVVGFNGAEPTYPYTFKMSIGQAAGDQDSLTQKLLAEIELLKKQIAQLQAASSQNPGLCSSISGNLYVGVFNKAEVTCLQEFLKNQGTQIYPEGLVTGNFGSLTRAAVIRFQETYATEILAPLGITKGTGFVGSLTRAKINLIAK